MNRGFTLIELLAVIILLSIIALIATPIILNIIDDVNQTSSEVSMQNIERAVSLYFNVQDKTENIVFECIDGKCKNGEDILKINGKSPEQGRILVDKKGNITYDELVINGYNCYKEHSEYVCNKEKLRKVFTENSIVLNTSKESNLLDYNIYGNTIHDGTPATPVEIESVGEITKNLFDYSTLLNNSYIEIIDEKQGEFRFTNTSKIPITYIEEKEETVYTLSYKVKLAIEQTILIQFYYTDGTYSSVVVSNGIVGEYVTAQGTSIANKTVDYIKFGGSGGLATGTYFKEIQIEEGSQSTDYEPYGYKIPIVVKGKNLFDKSSTPVKISSSDAYYEEIETGVKVVNKTTGSGWRNILYTIESVENLKNKVIRFEFDSIVNNTPIAYVLLPYIDENGNNPVIAKSIKMRESGKYVLDLPIDYNTYKEQFVGLCLYAISSDTEIIETLPSYVEYNNLNVSIIETQNIYLKEPLRCIDEKCDYLDFKNQKVVRYVERLEDGTLQELKTPKEEDVELPSILLNEGINNISIETGVNPSKIELEYYK